MTMTKMRATQHYGRRGFAKHNDRHFDLAKSDHIDATRTPDNIAVSLCGKSGNFEQDEINYYHQKYGAGVDNINTHYILQRHADRCRTIDDIYHSKQYQPDEIILQIGNRDEHVDNDTMRQVFDDYLVKIDDWNAEHGQHITILDYAIHYDETTPHVHMRLVYDYHDKDGYCRLGQNKALEMANVPLKDPDKPQGKYNNRKQVFTSMMRAKWLDVAKSHGIEIETVPIPGKSHHQDVDDYVRTHEKELLREREAEIDGLNEQIAEKNDDIGRLMDTIMYKTEQLADIQKKFQAGKAAEVETQLLIAALRKSADLIDADIAKKSVDLQRLGDWLDKAGQLTQKYKDRADVTKKYIGKTEQLALDSSIGDMQQQIDTMRDLHAQAIDLLSGLGIAPDSPKIDKQIQPDR